MTALIISIFYISGIVSAYYFGRITLLKLNKKEKGKSFYDNDDKIINIIWSVVLSWITFMVFIIIYLGEKLNRIKI